MDMFPEIIGEILDVERKERLPVIKAAVFGVDTGGHCCLIGDYLVPFDAGEVEPDDHSLVAVVFHGSRQMTGRSNPNVRAIMIDGDWIPNASFDPRREPNYCRPEDVED